MGESGFRRRKAVAWVTHGSQSSGFRLQAGDFGVGGDQTRLEGLVRICFQSSVEIGHGFQHRLPLTVGGAELASGGGEPGRGRTIE